MRRWRACGVHGVEFWRVLLSIMCAMTVRWGCGNCLVGVGPGTGESCTVMAGSGERVGLLQGCSWGGWAGGSGRGIARKMQSRSCMSQRIWCWSTSRVAIAPLGGLVRVVRWVFSGQEGAFGLVQWCGGGRLAVGGIQTVEWSHVVVVVVIGGVGIGLVLALLSDVGFKSVRS